MLAILEDELWKYSNLCFCLERMHRIIMYSDSSHSVLAICETKHAKAKYWISIKSMKKMGKERKRKKKQNPFFLLWHRYFLKISANGNFSYCYDVKFCHLEELNILKWLKLTKKNRLVWNEYFCHLTGSFFS